MRKNESWIRMYRVERCWRRIRRLRGEIAAAVKQGEPLTSPRLLELDEQICTLGRKASALEFGKGSL